MISSSELPRGQKKKSRRRAKGLMAVSCYVASRRQEQKGKERVQEGQKRGEGPHAGSHASQQVAGKGRRAKEECGTFWLQKDKA
jgi:hypothetical protein